MSTQEQATSPEDDWTFPESKPVWQCQECGHENVTRKIPANFFTSGHKPVKCPKCQSAAMQPRGL